MGRAAVELRILSAEEDRRLIALVQRWPELYDHAHDAYLDSSRKVGVWASIGEELAIDPRSCRNRWYNIRDNYRKSMIRNNYKRQLGKEVRVYKYTEELQFVHKHIKAVEGEASDSDEDDSGAEAPRKKRARPPGAGDEPLAKFVKVEAEADSEAEAGAGAGGAFAACEEAHPVDTFLACVGQTLRALPPYFLSLAKAEIFAVAQKYELRMYSPVEPRAAGDPLLAERAAD